MLDAALRKGTRRLAFEAYDDEIDALLEYLTQVVIAVVACLETCRCRRYRRLAPLQHYVTLRQHEFGFRRICRGELPNALLEHFEGLLSLRSVVLDPCSHVLSTDRLR